MKFIKATEGYNTFEKYVPAPYIRKSFVSDIATAAKVKIAVCGFYELFINGKKYTKGLLSPYISNPDHYVYYDEYEVPLDKGENVIGILLGNGFQNNPGGHIWDFDKSAFRSAPMTAVSITYKNADGEEVEIKSDSSFKTAPSAIRSDDYRFGEIYDANFEVDGWNDKGFDDSDWNSVIEVRAPRGQIRHCSAKPIVVEKEIKPVSITEEKNGYIFDFGESNAGVCRLTVNGQKGQEIQLRYADRVIDGELDIAQIWFDYNWEADKDIVHRDIYTCKGEGTEVYTPTFTYHGFRYVKVTGITAEQATEDLLTFVVFHTELNSRGDFSCSDETVNKLQEITRRSDTSNFHHFPTDCPQREKNGWAADAALSTEQLLLNFDPEVNYREWQRNICKAQNSEGALPGIIPTGGWGFVWGNGPAWDCILVYLPYFVYVYRGETEMIKESAAAFMSYLHYLTTRADEDGLMHIGLGDWCHVGDITPKCPLEVTDSIMSMDIANKMAFLFDAVGMSAQRDFAKEVANSFKAAIRKHLINFRTMTVAGNCQSSQAMCIFYGVFTPAESQTAFQRLLEMIHEADDHFDVGVLGARVLFHVLSEFGYSDLALKMIARPDYPSYGNWIERGATTLWEDFQPDNVCSMNHHFWGDISAWFIKCLAGIQFNPNGDDIMVVDIKPSFVSALDHAKAHYEAPAGLIKSEWRRDGDKIILSVTVPENMRGAIKLENGYVFEDLAAYKKVASGEYVIKKVK